MIAPAVPRVRWRRRTLLLSLVALPAACLAGAALLFVNASYRLTNPPEYAPLTPAAGTTTDMVAAYRSQNPRTEHGLEFRDVDVPTAGGATLRGWLVPAGSDIGIVAVHGRAGDRRNYLGQLPLFHRAGATTLLFDLREHGTSDGTGRGMSLGFREAEDVVAAARFLKDTVGVRRVVVVGHSLGGSAAILAAAQDRAIDGVLAEGSIARFEEYVHDLGEEWLARRRIAHLLPTRPRAWADAIVGFTAWRQGIPDLVAPVDVVDRIAPRPLLLVHGTGDTAVRSAHAERLFARAGEGRDLWLAPGAEHLVAFDVYPDEYTARLPALLERVRR